MKSTTPEYDRYPHLQIDCDEQVDRDRVVVAKSDNDNDKKN